MDAAEALAISRETLLTMLKIGSPIMLIALVVGLSISLIQALTQIQEITLTFVPKIVLVLSLFALLFPWMMRTILVFAHGLFETAATLG